MKILFALMVKIDENLRDVVLEKNAADGPE